MQWRSVSLVDLHLNSTMGLRYDARISVEDNVLDVVDVTEDFKVASTKAVAPFGDIIVESRSRRRLELICEDTTCEGTTSSFSAVLASWVFANSLFLLLLLVAAVSCWFLGRR